MGNDKKSRIISAAETAAISDVVNLTCDRIEALAGGHGMVNIAMFSVANILAEELQRGSSLAVKFANARRQPVDDIMRKAINAANPCLELVKEYRPSLPDSPLIQQGNQISCCSFCLLALRQHRNGQPLPSSWRKLPVSCSLPEYPPARRNLPNTSYML